jgi:hypothetical protein
MKKIFLLLWLAGVQLNSFSQKGSVLPASASDKNKKTKIVVRQEVLDYGGLSPEIKWTGAADKEGFASGEGELLIKGKVAGRSFMLFYKGALLKGKKEGQGSLLVLVDLLGYNSPEKFGNYYYEYKGSFKNDEMNGYGELGSSLPDILSEQYSTYSLHKAIWKPVAYFYEYKGTFKNNQVADAENGTGLTNRIAYVGAGATYTGPVKNGMPNGMGTASESDMLYLSQSFNGQKRKSLTGNFFNGRLNGKGKQTGRYFEYEGDFVNNIRQGKGKLTFYAWEQDDEAAKKARYPVYNLFMSSVMEGDFSAGEANGFFTIYYQHSATYKYTGPVKNGELEGTGEMEYLNGAKFRGNFRSGKTEGAGTVFFTNGDRFVGEYSNNLPVRGTLYYTDGSKYEGGMAIREEKDAVTGKPVNTYIRQGSGTMTDKDGRRYNVVCENGNCREGG